MASRRFRSRNSFVTNSMPTVLHRLHRHRISPCPVMKIIGSSLCAWYMVATADQSINPDQEPMMAKRANAKTIEVNSSHAAYICHPKELAKLIEEAAASGQRASQ